MVKYRIVSADTNKIRPGCFFSLETALREVIFLEKQNKGHFGVEEKTHKWKRVEWTFIDRLTR